MRKGFLLVGLILGCASPAVASPLPPPNPVVNGPPPSIPAARQMSDRAFRQLRSELIELRQLGLDLRASDGGTLTAEHRDFIQARIDAAYADYRRRNSRRR